MDKKRTPLRFLIFAILLGGSFLIIFTLLSNSANSTKIVNAFSDPTIPDYCIPIELQIIENNLSQDPDAKLYLLWIGKKIALEKSMQECALLAKTNPPAQKPLNEVSVIPPTSEPLPPQEIVTGIQKKILLPSNDFIPTLETENNYWAGIIDGKTIQILAGIQPEQDERWRESHPEWAEMGPQGAVKVLNLDWSPIALIKTPTRNGYIQFIKECNSQLLLQAEDGTMFVFDLDKLDFVSEGTNCSASDH